MHIITAMSGKDGGIQKPPADHIRSLSLIAAQSTAGQEDYGPAFCAHAVRDWLKRLDVSTLFNEPGGARRRHLCGERRQSGRPQRLAQSGPSMTGPVYLAHNDEDREAMRLLHGRRKQAGFTPGQEKLKHIDQAITSAAAVLACLSSATVGRADDPHRQLRQALSTRRASRPVTVYMIPVRLDDCALPDHRFGDLGLKLTRPWSRLRHACHPFRPLARAARLGARPRR